MSKRWVILLGLAILAVVAGCELATPPPEVIDTPVVTKEATATAVPLAVTTPIPWPAERFVFSHLEKIWLADRAAPYPLTTGEAPALSPDGQRVAYLLPFTETSPLNQVYVLDLTSDQIFLVSGDPAFYGPPVWSPDGRFVAYTNGSILVVTDPLGEVQRVLATDVGASGEGVVVPVWSADGRTIICPLTQLGTPEIFALSVEDGQVVRISYTGDYSASAPFVVLSRDTKVALKDTVLYVNAADGGTLWKASLDGADRQRIAPELAHITGLMRLSADGGRLAGLRQPPGGQGYTLWAIDLTIGNVYSAGTLAAQPSQLYWGADGQTLYWISQAALHRYTLAAGQGQKIAELPAPSPTPTQTPLVVEHRLIYYYDNAFYLAKAYAEAERLKGIPASQSVVEGYALREGLVAYPHGADVYMLRVEKGVSDPMYFPERLYSFQQKNLVRVDLVWSLQGNALLYAATYTQEDTTFGRRVDLGVINLDPATRAILRVHRFTSLMDRSGAAPILYDEARGEAIVLPWSGGLTFNRLDVYNVESGVEAGLLAVEGEGTAAVSADWHWAAATGYDQAAGRGFIRLYDLTAAETVSRTFVLPEGTFTHGPLYWSPDGQYVAFVPLRGTPGDDIQKAEGIWVLRAEGMEALPVVTMENPLVFLVGWGAKP